MIISKLIDETPIGLGPYDLKGCRKIEKKTASSNEVICKNRVDIILQRTLLVKCGEPNASQ